MTTTRSRHTAEERREAIIEAASSEFAQGGLKGTSTEAIAVRAGISQPYLFRLFGTKKDLFLAVIERCHARLRETFESAAAADEAGEPLAAMGLAYAQLLADREMLLVQMQTYAACSDPEIRRAASRGYAGLWELVQRLSGASDDEVRSFFAMGMLLNVSASMDLPEIAGEKGWAIAHLRELSDETAG